MAALGIKKRNKKALILRVNTIESRRHEHMACSNNKGSNSYIISGIVAYNRGTRRQFLSQSKIPLNPFGTSGSGHKHCYVVLKSHYNF